MKQQRHILRPTALNPSQLDPPGFRSGKRRKSPYAVFVRHGNANPCIHAGISQGKRQIILPLGNRFPISRCQRNAGQLGKCDRTAGRGRDAIKKARLRQLPDRQTVKILRHLLPLKSQSRQKRRALQKDPPNISHLPPQTQRRFRIYRALADAIAARREAFLLLYRYTIPKIAAVCQLF